MVAVGIAPEAARISGAGVGLHVHRAVDAAVLAGVDDDAAPAATPTTAACSPSSAPAPARLLRPPLHRQPILRKPTHLPRPHPQAPSPHIEHRRIPHRLRAPRRPPHALRLDPRL